MRIKIRVLETELSLQKVKEMAVGDIEQRCLALKVKVDYCLSGESTP